MRPRGADKYPLSLLRLRTPNPTFPYLLHYMLQEMQGNQRNILPVCLPTTIEGREPWRRDARKFHDTYDPDRNTSHSSGNPCFVCCCIASYLRCWRGYREEHHLAFPEVLAIFRGKCARSRPGGSHDMPCFRLPHRDPLKLIKRRLVRGGMRVADGRRRTRLD